MLWSTYLIVLDEISGLVHGGPGTVGVEPVYPHGPTQVGSESKRTAVPQDLPLGQADRILWPQVEQGCVGGGAVGSQQN